MFVCVCLLLLLEEHRHATEGEVLCGNLGYAVRKGMKGELFKMGQVGGSLMPQVLIIIVDVLFQFLFISCSSRLGFCFLVVIIFVLFIMWMCFSLSILYLFTLP